MTTLPLPTTAIGRPTRLHVFVANLRAEWTKLRSVRSTVWTLLATVGLAVGFGALIATSQMSSWDTLDAGERLRFDPTSFSLSGLFLAQLAVGVLGVLVITSEYATGQIRATLSATPQRLVVLAAKAATFAAVVLVTGLVASFAAFWTGQVIFASNGHVRVDAAEPDRLRALLDERGTEVSTQPDGSLAVTGLPAREIGIVAGAAGITLYELAPRSASLEEAFMELTRDAAEYTAQRGEAA